MPAEDAMEVQPLRQQEDRNPCTIEEARSFVRHVESLFMPWNIDALADGFTEDCTLRFGTVPEFRGRTALREFFTARSAKQKDYRLRKQLRVLAGDAMLIRITGQSASASSMWHRPRPSTQPRHSGMRHLAQARNP
jgi:nuclear transport factor 2 (NTF2) superfamily protein